MDGATCMFDELKLSAFSKYCKLTGDVHNLTLGPNQYKTPQHKTARASQNAKEVMQLARVEEKGVPIRHVVHVLEDKWKENVQKSISERYKMYVDFSYHLKQKLRDEWLLQQQSVINRMKQQEDAIIESLHNYDSSLQIENEKNLRHIEQHLAKSKERQRQINENFGKVWKVQNEVRNVYKDIIEAMRSCPKSDELKLVISEDLKDLKVVLDSLEEVVRRCKQGQCPESEVSEAEKISRRIHEIKANIQEAVNKINEQDRIIQEQPKKPQPTLVDADCVTPENLKRYLVTLNVLDEFLKSLSSFSQNPQTNKLKGDCKMAINLTINSLLPRTDNFLTRYLKLFNLLSGKDVPDQDQKFNASSHPQGINFCLEHLANRLVLRGNLTVNFESAFYNSTMIVTLWHDFPQFGTLVLGHFYKRCPYLVPYNIPMIEGQNLQEYYASLGYKVDKNGKIENHDEFLIRITGIFRLYFAMMIAKPKSGKRNPFGLHNGWKFFVDTLKLKPHLDITATALHSFLETIGFAMESAYGNAFRKLLRVLHVVYMPKLKEIDNAGPVCKLEGLLEKRSKSGKFARPPGILPDNFW